MLHYLVIFPDCVEEPLYVSRDVDLGPAPLQRGQGAEATGGGDQAAAHQQYHTWPHPGIHFLMLQNIRIQITQCSV